MTSPPDSPLSELSSFSSPKADSPSHDPFISQHDGHTNDASSALPPPAKRQRVDSLTNPHRPSLSLHPPPYADAPDTDISSDTSGSIPPSPTTSIYDPYHHDEDSLHEQVTVCQWTGCGAGDLGNMDSLVDHIHEDHIGTRQKKYACEWESCNRKGMPHASGYALRAHMRSHTKEKPFFCQLPGTSRPAPASRN